MTLFMFGLVYFRYSNLQNAHHFEEKMAITEEVKFFKVIF